MEEYRANSLWKVLGTFLLIVFGCGAFGGLVMLLLVKIFELFLGDFKGI